MTIPTALAITAAVLVLAVVLGLVLRSRDGRTRSGGSLHVRPEDVPGGLAVAATLVQFSTELCTRCPQVRRMLGSIAGGRDGLAHAEVDLTTRHDLATRYHVLQTPTTFLVDSGGAVISRWGGVPDRCTVESALDGLPSLQENR